MVFQKEYCWLFHIQCNSSVLRHCYCTEQYGLIPANPILLLMGKCCMLRLYWHNMMKEAVCEMRLHTKGQLIQWYQCIAKKSEVTHLFLHLWTTNGTICSTLGVMFSKTNLQTTHSNVRANDKVGLWMRAAATWNQRRLFWERKSLRGCWARLATPEGQLWQRVPGIICMWSTSGITVLNRNFQI